MGEWKNTTLADVASDISYGYTESASSDKVGPRFLRITDIQNGIVNWNTVPYCPISGADHRKYRLHHGDIVIARTGNSTGENFIYQGSEDAVYASYLIRFRVDAKMADPAFVWYNLRTSAWWSFINNSKTGSAQAGANAKVLGQFAFTLPPLHEQKRIAHILGTLDDKIELNRRMNATLEAMARALFKSWFVDFDPVRAKADGRKPVGIDPETAALFPSEFQDSSLGQIPKGWSIVRVDEICENIFSGGTPSTQNANYWGGEIPWLSSGETRSPFIIETEKTITEAGVKNSSTRLAQPGCTVIAGAGQGHTRGQTSLLLFESYINQSVVVLASNPNVSSNLFLFFDLARRYEEFRQLSDSHSSRGSLTTKLLAGVKMVLPSRLIIEKFDHAVTPLVDQITANLRQSRTLTALRDTLLPKLLSGELRLEVSTN